MDISSIAAVKLERDSWRDIEKLSRARKNKPLHTFAVKRISELGDIMVSVASDEMEDITENQNKTEGSVDESFYS